MRLVVASSTGLLAAATLAIAPLAGADQQRSAAAESSAVSAQASATTLSVSARKKGKRLPVLRHTKVVRTVTTNATLRRVKTVCFFDGKKLSKGESRQLCRVEQLVRNGKSEPKVKVTVAPVCSGLSYTTKITAKAQDRPRTKWQRTWRVKKSPQLDCSAVLDPRNGDASREESGEPGVRNVVYIGRPSQVPNMKNYRLFPNGGQGAGVPFFDTVVLFAANINGTLNEPTLGMGNIQPFPDISGLQGDGITVLLTYLPNHTGVGWSCPNMTAVAAKSLASQMVSVVQQTGVDGLSIDAEYAECPKGNNLPGGDAWVMDQIVSSIKRNPGFRGKTLSMSVWPGTTDMFFQGRYNIASKLDQAYTETYGFNDVNYLQMYVTAGMKPSQLGVGLNPAEAGGRNTAENAQQQAKAVADQGYGYMMVFAPDHMTTQQQATYYTAMAQGEYGPQAEVRYLE